MIQKETVDKIIQAAKIEDVVGDYVSLKKRGVNLLGLCPFHSERTPSFTVSAPKGIFKCFGCGKGGDSVTFLMEHDQLSYVDALKYLARKYNIEIVEKEYSAEEKQQIDERESIFAALDYAKKKFAEQLNHTETGKAIGLSYFAEREISSVSISKFELGYAQDGFTKFLEQAIADGYREEFLLRAGLVSKSEKDGRLYDRFSGRVIFPIHNIAGRVVGFGGRTLGNKKEVAKYLNSPETEVYHKSQVLYGLYFAKRAIVSKDNCFLVEGYTDVISLHQAGIENVVASSGTSLTEEQIRLIRRFTKNITILYDGDSAGIKASFRGINMILEEGMNVKVLLFPDGEDPDSFSRKNPAEEVQKFIDDNSTDFIRFKTSLLLKDIANDPIEKAKLLKDIMESVSLIPDAMIRSAYVKECSRLLDTEEQILIFELNKNLRKRREEKQKSPTTSTSSETTSNELQKELEEQDDKSLLVQFSNTESQEKDIIRLLLNHAEKELLLPAKETDEIIPFKVYEFIFHELSVDHIQFSNPLYQKIYQILIHSIDNNEVFNAERLLNLEDEEIKKLTIDLTTEKYQLSNHWSEKHKIHVQIEDNNLLINIQSALLSLKSKLLLEFIKSKQQELLKEISDEKFIQLKLELDELEKLKKEISAMQQRVILK